MKLVLLVLESKFFGFANYDDTAVTWLHASSVITFTFQSVVLRNKCKYIWNGLGFCYLQWFQMKLFDAEREREGEKKTRKGVTHHTVYTF